MAFSLSSVRSHARCLLSAVGCRRRLAAQDLQTASKAGEAREPSHVLLPTGPQMLTLMVTVWPCCEPAQSWFRMLPTPAATGSHWFSVRWSSELPKCFVSPACQSLVPDMCASTVISYIDTKQDGLCQRRSKCYSATVLQHSNATLPR